MIVHKTKKSLKKNTVFFIQLCVLVSLLGVLFEYIATIDNTTVDIVSIGKDDSLVQSIPKTDQLQEIKREAKAPSPATFEVDEVSRDMLDNNANNPQGVLSEDTPCARFEDVHTVFRRNGTVSKARNVEPFKKPLPAMITEIQYTSVLSKQSWLFNQFQYLCELRDALYTTPLRDGGLESALAFAATAATSSISPVIKADRYERILKKLAIPEVPPI